LGKGFLKDFQPLPAQLDLNVAHARDVPTRLSKTGDQSVSYGVATQHNDGNGLGRLLCRNGRAGSWRHDHVSFELDQLSGYVGENFPFPVIRAIINGEVLALNPTEAAQLFPERYQARRRCIPENPYPRILRRLLRLGGDAKRQEHSAKS